MRHTRPLIIYLSEIESKKKKPVVTTGFFGLKVLLLRLIKKVK